MKDAANVLMDRYVHTLFAEVLSEFAAGQLKQIDAPDAALKTRERA